MAGRSDAEDRRYSVPPGARGNARRVLAWREKHPDLKGMTEAGWRRARQLATEGTVSYQDIVEIAAWFARHAGNEAVSPENRETPWRDAGYVAWLGWGGDSARAWAGSIVDRNRDGLERQVRLDAEISPEGICLLLPLTGEALRQWERVRDRVRALLPDLPPPPGRPHVTALYLGQPPAEGLGEIVSAATETVRLQSPVPFYAHRVHAFAPSPSSDGETPVIIEVGWGFEALHVALLQRLAPWVQVQQFSPYRAHATLGYLPRPLTDAERADLAALVIEPSEGPPPRLSRVDLCRGEEVIAVLPLAAVGEEL